MVDLLNNVGILMNTKFAKGAEGAAKTFQGAINNMQTSLLFSIKDLNLLQFNF
jgi:ketosteroid isomerase-like protein